MIHLCYTLKLNKLFFINMASSAIFILRYFVFTVCCIFMVQPATLDAECGGAFDTEIKKIEIPVLDSSSNRKLGKFSIYSTDSEYWLKASEFTQLVDLYLKNANSSQGTSEEYYLRDYAFRFLKFLKDEADKIFFSAEEVRAFENRSGKTYLHLRVLRWIQALVEIHFQNERWYPRLSVKSYEDNKSPQFTDKDTTKDTPLRVGGKNSIDEENSYNENPVKSPAVTSTQNPSDYRLDFSLGNRPQDLRVTLAVRNGKLMLPSRDLIMLIELWKIYTSRIVDLNNVTLNVTEYLTTRNLEFFGAADLEDWYWSTDSSSHSTLSFREKYEGKPQIREMMDWVSRSTGIPLGAYYRPPSPHSYPKDTISVTVPHRIKEATTPITNPIERVDDVLLKTRTDLVEQIRTKAADNIKYKEIYYDLFATHWLMKQGKSSISALLLGNLFEPPNADLVREAIVLVEKLAKNGHRIIYDADTLLAPHIARAAGASAIGISGRIGPFDNLGDDAQVLSISNPYIRMRMFSENAQVVVSDPTSVTGAGLMIERKVDVLLDLRNRWIGGDSRWVVGSRLSNGIESNPYIARETNGHDLFRTLKYRLSSRPGATRFETYNFEEFLRNAPEIFFPGDLEDFLQTSDAIVHGQTALEKIDGSRAVVFGSAQNISEYEALVRNTTSQLVKNGFSITTGGMGGFMEVANRSALENGGVSIGIPIGGVFLKNERTAMTDAHSLTVNSYGYESRIPLLLYKQQLIVVAPGARGTLKELATSFVRLAAQLEISQTIVFLSPNYYKELYAWLQWLNLPKIIKDRIRVVASPEEIEEITRELSN